MPSPIGHSLAALVAYRSLDEGASAPRSWRILLCYCFAASAPDCDFLPGLLLGDPNRFHQGVSHSVGMALLFATFIALFSWWAKGRIRWKFVLVLFALYCSHLLFDYLSMDTGVPYGIPVWWPFSREHYLSPIPVFADVHRGHSLEEFFSWSHLPHNLWAVTLEVLILLPFVGLVGGLQRRRDRYLQGKRLHAVEQSVERD